MKVCGQDITLSGFCQNYVLIKIFEYFWICNWCFLLACFNNVNAPIFTLLFRRQDFGYDRMTAQTVQISFLIFLSCNLNWIACVTSFTPLMESFFSVRVINFSVIRGLLTLKNDFFDFWEILTFETAFLTFESWNGLFSLIQRDKLKWARETLFEISY